MRKSALVFLAVLVLATVGGLQPAAAESDCNVDTGADTAPQLEDPVGDYAGVVGGNGQALIPYGDVYGDGTDLIAGWINRTGSVWTANIQTASWQGLETNAIYYFLWTYDSGVAGQNRKWVSAQLTRALPTPLYQYRYGYLDESGPVGNFTQLGTTTGTMTAGTPGRFTITIPMNRLGNPGSGATLGAIKAEARVLLGTAQTGGLVGIADDTDPTPCADLTVP